MSTSLRFHNKQPLFIAVLITMLMLPGALAPAQDPGLAYPSTAEVSDQKAGSILIFNFYTSGATPAARLTQNTEISITNTNSTAGATLRLFFVAGGGAVTRALTKIGRLGTLNFSMGDVDPGVTGYLAALAVDDTSGCPINFNHLIGQADIKLTAGQSARLGAIAIAAIAPTPASCLGGAATLSFDNVNFNRLPRMLAVQSIVSRAGGNDTLLVLNRIGGSLAPSGSVAGIGTLSGLLYDDAEIVFPFSQGSLGPQLFSVLSDSFPVTTPPFQTAIPSGRVGWMKLFGETDIAMLGAVLNTNPMAGASAGAFKHGHNLTHQTLTSTAALTVSTGIPDLAISKTHSGSFTANGAGSYTITVTNIGNGVVSGSTQVTDILPGELTLDSFSGAGWTCTGAGTAAVNCVNSTPVNPASSYPPLTLNVNVGPTTPIGVNSITNTAEVITLDELDKSNNRADDPTTINSSVPIIASLSPNRAVAGFPGFTLTVNGSGFLPSSIVQWNGGNRRTTYVDPTKLTAEIPAIDIANAGTASVTVFNPGPGGGVSNALTFTISLTSDLTFYPLPQPIRLLDTRSGQSACFTPGSPLGDGSTRDQQAIGACSGIPASAKAIVGNATVVNSISNGGFITLFPSDSEQPIASNLNFTANQIVPNSFTVGLGDDGAFKIFASAATHFIVDVTGYYAPPGQGGLYFHPLPAPLRLLDTRQNQTACDTPGAPLANNGVKTVTAHRTCLGATIPSSAKAIVGNATVVNFISSGNNYITLYPFGASQPNASNLNYTANQIVPNAFVAGLSNDGKFNIFSSGATDFIVDVAGYFSEEQFDLNGQGLFFNPLPTPVRLLDTRQGQTACDAPGLPLGNDATQTQSAHRTCFGVTIPNTAKAVVGNGTVVNFISSGFHWITLYPFGTPQPNASNLNFTLNQIVPNAFVVGLSNDGRFNIYSHASTDFIVDLTGYFAP